MKTHKRTGFWKLLNVKFNNLREELRKDSVASNPVKPVDCCNPPVYEKKAEKSDGGSAR